MLTKAEEEAKAKIDQITKEAQDRIKLDTAKARKELEGDLVGLSF